MLFIIDIAVLIVSLSLAVIVVPTIIFSILFTTVFVLNASSFILAMFIVMEEDLANLSLFGSQLCNSFIFSIIKNNALIS
jgi:hypothetical protein